MKIASICKVAQCFVLCLLFCSAAWGQQVTETVQTLDRVDVNSRTNVLEMEFADSLRMADFFNTGVSGSDFRACKLTALDGLYCLDGRVVKRWPTTFDDPLLTSDDPQTIINCADSALDLDTRKADTCTALTVDLSGTIWLAGKSKKGPTFVLYRIVEHIVEQDGSSCPDGIAELTLTRPPQSPQPPQPLEPGDTVYCAEQIASDKPLLIDLNSIDGDVAEEFPLGRGVLYLEARKTAVFQSDDGLRSTIIASGGKGWGLDGNEKLQSIALWQSPDGNDNRILVTTDRGRVLAVAVDKDDDTVGPPNEVFNVVTGRANRDPQDRMATQCDFSIDPRYAVRTSSKSGLVYVTDRQCNEVLALEGDGTAAFMLDNAQEPSFDAGTGLPICNDDLNDDPTSDPPCQLSGQQVWDLTLSTADSSGTFPPEGPTVAPGIGIDLRTCAGFCALVFGDDGAAAASLANVTLLNPDEASGLTLFQIKNIPDCRYVPSVCEGLLVEFLAGKTLQEAGVVVPLDPGDPNNPAAQRLNITPLLPAEITDLFEDIGGLPAMYMSRFTRGQKARTFTFEAFFGRTEDGVVFRSTFDGEFDVDALAGSSLGCQSTFPAETPVEHILLWDTVTTVSERYIGTNDKRVDTLINVDCGSSRTIDGRWSLKPYNTEITPCTWTDDPLVWDSDGSCLVGGSETVDDAVFAKLLLALYDDFGEALEQLACVNVDVLDAVTGVPDDMVDAPLSPGVCSTAQSQWANGLQKLERCWDATQQPKESSGNQNCQSFESQFGGLRSTIVGATPFGPDPANRVGELVARLAVIDHVYEDRFVPSIPANGFCEPDNPLYQPDQNCTAP